MKRILLIALLVLAGLLVGCGPKYLGYPDAEESLRKVDTSLDFLPQDDIEKTLEGLRQRPFLVAEDYATDIHYSPPLGLLDWTNLIYVSLEGKFILVDNKVQRLWAFEDGMIVAYFVVSTGRRSLPTRPGDYRIGRKLKKSRSNVHVEGGKEKWWGMDYFQDIYPLGCGFHALPSLYYCYQEVIDHLGTPVSHSCVRLGHIPLESLGEISPAAWFFNWTDEGINPYDPKPEDDVGTPIKIVGIYRRSTRIEKDHSQLRKFSPEIGFYFEEFEEDSN